MRVSSFRQHGFTLVEMVMTTGILSAVGLAIFSMLNTGMILGAKNTAVNTAHQNARTAMLQMIADLHGAISLPYLIDDPNVLDATGKPQAAASTPAAGIAFQLFSMGPLKVVSDVPITSNQVTVKAPSGNTQVPLVGQRLIILTHKIEDNITAVVNNGINNGSYSYTLTLSNNIANAIQGTGGSTNYNIVGFITDRCSYTVINGALDWKGPGARSKFAVLGNGITNGTPFTTPTTAAGAYDYKFIAAINLSTTDSKYSNRGFKSANILLNGKVPTRTRLTTYQ
jgi:type II secretory pathway component PulJ